MSRFESVLILKLDDYKLYFLNHDVVLCAVLYFSPAAVPAGKVTEGLAESNVSLPPGGWLPQPVHRDQLRAQRSVTNMGSL